MRQMPTQATSAAEAGATATEYVFLLAMIALVAAVGIVLYGGSLGALFDKSASEAQASTTSS